MSGECNYCGEHAVDCRCHPSPMQLAAKVQWYFDYLKALRNDLHSDYETAKERENEVERDDDIWTKARYTQLEDFIEEYYLLFEVIIVNK